MKNSLTEARVPRRCMSPTSLFPSPGSFGKISNTPGTRRIVKWPQGPRRYTRFLSSSFFFSCFLSPFLNSLFLLSHSSHVTFLSHRSCSLSLALSGRNWEGREEARTLRLKARVSLTELPNWNYRFMECLRSNCSDIFDVFYKYCGQIYFFSSSLPDRKDISIFIPNCSSFARRTLEFWYFRSYLNSLWY